MTVSEKHRAEAERIIRQSWKTGNAIDLTAAALAAAEREGMRRAAEIARGSSGDFDFQSALAEGRDFDYGFHNGKNHAADSIRAAILAQANTHSPDPSSHQVNSPASNSSPEPGTPFQAKASEDNGATVPQDEMREADNCMAGEVSRVDAGRTASATSEDGRDGPERRAPHSHASRNGEG